MIEPNMASSNPMLVPRFMSGALLQEVSRVDWRAVWQLSSMTLGAGVFTLPAVFLQLGLVQATVSVLVMGLFANFGMQRLLDLSGVYGTSASYEAVAQQAFGTSGLVAIVAITVVTPLIASMSYLNTASQLLEQVFVSFFLDIDINAHPVQITMLSGKKNVCMLAALVAVVLPACLSPTLRKNVWISKLGIFTVCLSTLYFVARCAAILANGCRTVPCGDSPPLVSRSLADSLQATGTLAFSFSTVFAIFPTLEEAMTKGPVRDAVGTMPPPDAVGTVKVAVKYSVLICCTLYCVVGLVGAVTFGTLTKTIALSNLPLSEPLTQMITLLLGLSVELLVAIVSFPTVHCLSRMCCSRCNGKERVPIVVTVGTLLVVLDSVLPTAVCFTLAGALGLSLAAYIVPSVIFFKLGGGHALTSHALRCNRMLAFVVAVFGVVMLFGSTPVALARLHRSHSAHVSIADLLCNLSAPARSANASALLGSVEM